MEAKTNKPKIKALLVLLAVFFFSPAQAVPYKLPTLRDQSGDQNIIEPFKQPPKIDDAEMNRLVIKCYPAPSLFDNLDVSLKGGYQQYQNSNDYQASGNFAAIVFSVPLFSLKEVDREREREFGRRVVISKAIAQYSKNIHQVRHFQRMISLYTSLEQRSQMRVKKGIASLKEQIEYIERLSGFYSDLEAEKALLKQSELIILSHCTNDSKAQARLRKIFQKHRRQ